MSAMSQTFEKEAFVAASKWGKAQGFGETYQVGNAAPREIETSVQGNTIIVRVTQSVDFGLVAPDGDVTRMGRMNITREVHIDIGSGQSEAMGETYSFGQQKK